MTREQAIKRLQRLYGKKAYWTVGQSITSPEKREEASVALSQARIDREANKAERDAWLKAQPEYQAMLVRMRELDQIVERSRSECSRFKFHVGRNIGFAFEVLGSGDTWEEAIEKAEAKVPKAGAA